MMTRYKVQSRSTYLPIRSMLTTPALHEAFRREWEANFDSAMEKARQLEKQGFLVEESLQRGALMESKAKQLSKQLQERGFQVELIPVAKWGKEQAVFLIYKPPEKPVEPKPSASASKTMKPLSVQQIIQNFYTQFESDDDPSKLSEGAIIDKEKVVGVVDINAVGTTERAFISKRGKQAKDSGIKLSQFYNNSDLRAAVRYLKSREHKWISPDYQMAFPINIDYFLRILRVLGDGLIVAYAPDKNGPIYFFNERAPSNIAVACVKDYNANVNETDTMDYVIGVARRSFGYNPQQ